MRAASTDLVRTGAVALLGAGLFQWLATPLPWLLGPLFAVGGLRMAGVALHSPMPVRNLGQWVIGTALGLYFTPVVLAGMISLWWSILLGLVFAWVLSLLFGEVLTRIAGLDPVTAFFSATIGGASEMAVQGERHGAQIETVVAIHTLRVMIVVVSLPFAYRWLDLQGTDAALLSQQNVHVPGLLLLCLVTLIAALLVRRLGWPNAWMIGPLLATIAITGTGYNSSALPELVLKLGQVFIGMSLGSRFRPESLRVLRPILPIVIGSIGLLMAISALFGTMLGQLSGVPMATMILATSPGGIAEMSLTAKLLRLGVPTVTVFHVTRLAFILLTVGPVWQWVSRRRGWQ